MSEFKSYIEKIVKNISCSEEEKQELIEEFNDHLNLLKKEYMDKGYIEEQAVQMSIKTFGDEQNLGKEFKKYMFPYKRLIKNILGGSLFLLFISVATLVWVGLADASYNKDKQVFTHDVLNSINNDGILTTHEQENIESKIDSFIKKYPSHIIYIGLFYEENGVSVGQNPIHTNLNEAKYLFPNQVTPRDLGVSGLSLDNKWFLEIQQEETNDLKYIIPIGLIVISIIAWFVLGLLHLFQRRGVSFFQKAN